MAKNNNYINGQKIIYRQHESDVPAVYASIAMVLHNGNMDYDTINHIFCESQRLWQEYGSDTESMLIECFNKTGIQLMTDKQYKKAVEKGLIKWGE